MILPKVRDPRFITVRRGGSLQDDDHHLLAVWAADCAEHVLHHFEQARPGDDRPRRAIDLARAWARGEVTMTQARSAGGHANAAARELSGAARHAAYAAGQAGAVAHVAAHELGAAAYAIKAARAASPEGERVDAGRRGVPVAARPASRARSASSCSTTSGCATSCAGSSSTAERSLSNPSSLSVLLGSPTSARPMTVTLALLAGLLRLAILDGFRHQGLGFGVAEPLQL